MIKVYCDICKKDMDEQIYDIDFASIKEKNVRLYFDCDICNECIAKAYKITYQALKTHLDNNIKMIGKWNKNDNNNR